MPKVIASFFTVWEAMQFIESKGLDNVIIDRDLFTGKYDVLDLEGGE